MAGAVVFGVFLVALVFAVLFVVFFPRRLLCCTMRRSAVDSAFLCRFVQFPQCSICVPTYAKVGPVMLLSDLLHSANTCLCS